MSTNPAPHMAEELVELWAKTLPQTLNDSDKAIVQLDEHDPDLLRIHIETEGRTGYSFDFTARYLDDREVNIELSDVERDRISVDERTEIIQTLIEDYVRHIHECAQILHRYTHA